ncbi:MAG: hypothetical protein DRO87_09670 [Candidatus Thorarchaeota archaeon]|nr:MAG: hypothetical protein DRO87_09670 [Candidatus Thorarchaeota archaeon]RLI54982.1 MAG: hypothetical protein DRP09_11380 [Candidatus Thorarchaeota archaeon]
MVFKNLADYHLWAGWKMRSVLKRLDSDTFSQEVAGRSVKELVQHIVLALETCFMIAEDSSDRSMFDRIKRLPRQELLKRWEVLDTRLSNTIEEIPQGEITITHIRDEPFDVDVFDFYLQYVFHTTHHRGQLVLLLRQLGYDVPGTDYLMFLAETS